MSQDQRIIFTRPDGGVSVIVPAPGVDMARVMQDIPADAISPEVVDVAVIPADRVFRNGWKQEGKKCVEDLAKCKEICHTTRRAVRDAEFIPLDREVTIPAKATEAEAKREAIRQKHAAFQVEIDAAADTQALRAVLAKLVPVV